MQKVCGIYLLRNVVNGKVYVGQSVNCHMRLKQHIKESKRNRSRSHLYKAMRKHGHDSFEMEILEEVAMTTQDHLDDRECYWIKRLDACNPSTGYNFRPGGQQNQVVDAEARERISAKLRGRKQPPELVERNKQSHIGIPCTESAKLKISAFHAGKTLDRDAAEAIKIDVSAQFNRPEVKKRSIWSMPQEVRDQVSARFKGKPKSEETRRRMSEARKNASPESEARRLAVLRAVTQARWAKHREAQASGVAA